MNSKTILTLTFDLALHGVIGYARSEIPSEQIARLGADLTPLGGERAANANGTIPEWDGGIARNTQPNKEENNDYN